MGKMMKDKVQRHIKALRGFELRDNTTPSSIREFDGRHYFLLTKPLPKARAVAIAQSYRDAGSLARLVQAKDGFVVYTRGA